MAEMACLAGNGSIFHSMATDGALCVFGFRENGVHLYRYHGWAVNLTTNFWSKAPFKIKPLGPKIWMGGSKVKFGVDGTSLLLGGNVVMEFKIFGKDNEVVWEDSRSIGIQGRVWGGFSCAGNSLQPIHSNDKFYKMLCTLLGF